MPQSSQKATILSIDGGGIKGIVPAAILSYIENKIRETDPDFYLYQAFDLIGGTSTGGIIALGLLCPVPDEEGGVTSTVPYSAIDLLNLYKQHGSGIFDTNFFGRLWNPAEIFDEKYSAGYLEDQLQRYFGETRLSQLLKPCLITAYDIFQRKGVFFNAADGQEKGDRNDFPVRAVARATSAAPTYFEPANIHAIEGATALPLVDGGIFANNPSMCSLVEMSKLLSKRVKESDEKTSYRLDLKNIRVISISTGLNSANIERHNYAQAKGYGKVQWVAPLIDIMMSASSETIHYQLQTIYQCTGNEDNYVRLTPELYRASPKMDDASAANIDHLLQDADQYINENRDLLDKLAAELMPAGKG